MYMHSSDCAEETSPTNTRKTFRLPEEPRNSDSPEVSTVAEISAEASMQVGVNRGIQGFGCCRV